jgi:hypothetical protein
MHDALLSAGFLTPALPEHVRRVITQTTCLGHEIFRDSGAYDFTDGSLVTKLKAQSPELSKVKPYLTSPPAPLLFFQRKVVGTYLMCRKLRCQVDCRTQAKPYLPR